ncbi:MAG: hypothetical protein PF904_12020 [Kiritimatiellae bacterium]|nr:hypothetical protein [Kiritimatiellia bacterium]
MAAEDAFIYSNTTETQPPVPEKLKRIWGCGSSPCVSFGGSGTYFLDRVTSGVWRLQVYPDIFNVADAYTGTDQRKVYLLPVFFRASRHSGCRVPDLTGGCALLRAV